MTKQDVYSAVTDRIVAALESGVVPWRKPWSTGSGMPVNIRNGRAYRGVNVLLLGLAGYSDPRWGTYKAIRECGGQVRRGEKGTRVILWKPTKSREDENGERRDYLLLRDYTVFNAEQCDGIEPLTHEQREHTPDAWSEQVVSSYCGNGGPGLFHGYSGAWYEPARDIVKMPDAGTFVSGASYYSVLFHELTHSTGHESRLKRIEPALFGSDPYAREELVAEIGAAMLAGLAGFVDETTDMSAAYIAGWLERLKDDRKLIVNAAAQAQKAVDLIVGETFAETSDELQEVAA